MKRNAKVNRVRFHIGVQVGAEVRTGVDAERQKAEMELTAAGVFIRISPWADTFVPFSNITEVHFVLDKEEM